MNYYLLGTVIVFVFFGALSYVFSTSESKKESAESPADDSGDTVIAKESYPENVSGLLPVSNGFADPEYRVDCNGLCTLNSLPISISELDPKFATFGDSIKPVKKTRKKSIKKATKKTKKSKKPSKKK